MAFSVTKLVNGTIKASTPRTVSNPTKSSGPTLAQLGAQIQKNTAYNPGYNAFAPVNTGIATVDRSASSGGGANTSANAPTYGGSSGSNSASSTISANPSNAPAAPVYQDRSNDIAVQNAGLGAIDGQTSAGITAIDKALGLLKGGYSDETKANEANYNNESNSNQNTQQGGKQTAYVRAAQGRQGLLGTLASIGALSGDSIELANRAVQNGANEDLSGVNHNFATNQSGLDTAIGTYRREDKLRNDEADAQAENARTNARGQGLQTRQSFYQNLVKDYADEGNSAQAKAYTDKVAELYPQIAAANVPNASLVTKNAAYTPAALSTYLNNANTAVTTTPAPGSGPNNLPTLSAVNPLRKDQLAPAAG